jgi:hypothetical protein
MRPGQGRNVEVEGEMPLLGEAWAGALAYCAITFTLFWIAAVFARELPFKLITGTFAAFGFVALYFAMRTTLDRRAFGAMRLRVAAIAPSVGGRFMGSLRISESAAVRGTVRAELRCIHYQFDEKRTRSEQVAWSGERSFPIRRQVGGSYAILEFDIPMGLTPSNAPTPTGGVVPGWRYARWELQAIAESGGAFRDELYVVTVKASEDPGSMPLEVARRALPEPESAAPLPTAPAAVPDEHPLEIVRAAAAAPAVKPKVPRPVEEVQDLAEPEVLPPREPDRASIALLVAANLVPIAGVAFWGWQVQQVVFLYWMENLVIGGFNVLRILALEGKPEDDVPGKFPVAGKIFIAGFFTVHYGGFCFGHGVFLSGFFGRGGDGTVGGMLARMLHEPVVVAALAALLVSHGWSFFRNYIGRGEYQRVEAGDLMTAPYKRIVFTHVFVIFGGFLLSALKSQLLPMLLFVGMKTGFDLYFHRREHRGQSKP